MAQKVPEHIDHQNYRAKQVQRCCYDSVPESLRVDFTGSWWNVYRHRGSDANQYARGEVEEYDSGWTSNNAAYIFRAAKNEKKNPDQRANHRRVFQCDLTHYTST